jgi:hypothetical protein
MNYKKQIFSLVAFSILWIIFQVVVLCKPSDPNWSCQNYQPEWVQIPLLFFAAIFVLGIPLYFLKEVVYLAWRKFALWYLPIVAVILMFSSNSGGNGFNPGYGFDTESLTFFFSGLFALISLVIIAVKSWKLRGK